MLRELGEPLSLEPSSYSITVLWKHQQWKSPAVTKAQSALQDLASKNQLSSGFWCFALTQAWLLHGWVEGGCQPEKTNSHTAITVN